MIYVDTSVVVALLTREPSTEDVIRWYSNLNEAPVSSDWLLTEFTSAISIKTRTGQLTEVNAKAIHREFNTFLSGGLRLTPVSRQAFRAAADLTQNHKHSLRAGDSLHLAIAQEVGAQTIATLDCTMLKNALRLGMGSVPF